jgi:hypothetical protein
LSSCIRPAARGTEGGHFFLLHHHALELLKAVCHVAEDGLAHIGARHHDVPEPLLIELEHLAGLGGLHAERVGSVGKQRHLSKRRACGKLGHGESLPVLQGLDAHLAAEEDPERVRNLTLLGEEVAFRQAQLASIAEAVYLLLGGRLRGWGRRAAVPADHRSCFAACSRRSGLARSQLDWIAPIAKKLLNLLPPVGYSGGNQSVTSPGGQEPGAKAPWFY